MGLDDKGIKLGCDESAAELIVEEAFDAEYGARPVRRFVESEVVTEVSKLLIANSLPKDSTLRIRAAKHKLVYDVEDGNAKKHRGPYSHHMSPRSVNWRQQQRAAYLGVSKYLRLELANDTPP